MKLTVEQLNYFTEVGCVYRVTNELKQHGVEVVFTEHGYRVSEIGKKPIRQEYFETARELRMYLNGILDGYWHSKSGQKPEFGNKDWMQE